MFCDKIENKGNIQTFTKAGLYVYALFINHALDQNGWILVEFFFAFLLTETNHIHPDVILGHY